MLALVSSIFVLVFLFYLIRKDIVDSEIVSPIFLGLFVLSLLSVRIDFIYWIAERMGIVYSPLAILLIIQFIMVLAVTILAIGYTTVRRRIVRIVLSTALSDLDCQWEQKNKS